MTRRRFVQGAIGLGAALCLPGCGYSLSGRGSFLPAYIRVIGVPMFVNGTSIYDVEKRITDRVRSELIGRGKYTIKDQATGVDGLIIGTITSISTTPAAVTDTRLASRYVFTLTASVEFRDVKANKLLWSNPSVMFREEYDVTSTSSATSPQASVICTLRSSTFPSNVL
ncbi:MAG: LPS assembly lipoprotein LptE [Acidobacteriota bacterium]